MHGRDDERPRPAGCGHGHRRPRPDDRQARTRREDDAHGRRYAPVRERPGQTTATRVALFGRSAALDRGEARPAPAADVSPPRRQSYLEFFFKALGWRYTTAFLVISFTFVAFLVMNLIAIGMRNHLRKKYRGSAV